MADICLKSVTCAAFDPYEGAEFTVTAFGNEYTFTLADAQALPAPKVVPAGCRAEPFTLKFKGPEDVHLPQGTYTVSNAQCGTAEIFLVPVTEMPGGDASTVVYQAVFN
ncbi:MAG TPA: hypothetical protein VLL76_04005 [Candidatus Omnitrophota bacterium]|nr:hypothetical protein [Candidatus Omnitrophota bacterium]